MGLQRVVEWACNRLWNGAAKDVGIELQRVVEWGCNWSGMGLQREVE